MSEITSGAVSQTRTSVVDESAQQTYNRIAETLQDRKVYEAQNPNPRSLSELAYTRTLMQPRSEAVAAMYARTAESFGNDQGKVSPQGANSVHQASNGKASGSAVTPATTSGTTSATSDWSPVSLPMLKRIYGDAATFESQVESVGSRAGKTTNAKNARVGKGKELSARKAEDKTATAGGSNVRFAGLKSLLRGFRQGLSSLFTRVSSKPGSSVSRFQDLSSELRAKIKQHEAVQTARHDKMRGHLKTRGGDYDARTQKFADLFARRMKHFDNLSANFRKERLVTYKQIRKETEAILKDCKGKVFTPDDKYHEMIHNLENMNNLFFQDIDMELFELKITGK